jgi:hypothetical protein
MAWLELADFVDRAEALVIAGFASFLGHWSARKLMIAKEERLQVMEEEIFLDCITGTWLATIHAFCHESLACLSLVQVEVGRMNKANVVHNSQEKKALDTLTRALAKGSQGNVVDTQSPAKNLGASSSDTLPMVSKSQIVHENTGELIGNQTRIDATKGIHTKGLAVELEDIIRRDAHVALDLRSIYGVNSAVGFQRLHLKVERGTKGIERLSQHTRMH